MALHGRRRFGRFALPAFDAPSSFPFRIPAYRPPSRKRGAGTIGANDRRNARVTVRRIRALLRSRQPPSLHGAQEQEIEAGGHPGRKDGRSGGAGVGGDRGASARARGGDAGEAGAAGTELRSAAPVPRPWLTGRASPRPVRLSVRVPLHAVSWRLPISNRLRTDRKITSRIRTGRRIGPERSPSRCVLRHSHV